MADKAVADIVTGAIDDYMVGIFDADAQELAERLKLHVLEALLIEQINRNVHSPAGVPEDVRLAYLRLAQTAVSVAGHKVQQKPVDEIGQAAAVADAKIVSTWFNNLSNYRIDFTNAATVMHLLVAYAEPDASATAVLKDITAIFEGDSSTINKYVPQSRQSKIGKLLRREEVSDA